MCKSKLKIVSKSTLQLESCLCNTCGYYYNVYEARTAITNRKEENNLVLKHLCFCSANMIGLPFFQDTTGKLCPDVVACGNYEESKEV